MGGFFGIASKQQCNYDLYYGVDYHSHLGTRRGGMAMYDRELGFQRQIHNIENTPFRTQFENDLIDFEGCVSGIGCISDNDPQPLLIRSHLGTYAITTIGAINNAEELMQAEFAKGHQFMGRSTGTVNETELVACLINQKETLVEGIKHAQDIIQGSVHCSSSWKMTPSLLPEIIWADCPYWLVKTKKAMLFPSNPLHIRNWVMKMHTNWAPAKS